MEESTKKKIIATLIIIWMGLIFYLSNQPASVSANQSEGMINTIIQTPIIGDITKPILTSPIGEFIIRKSAHMFLYFVLAILIYSYLPNKNTYQKVGLVTLIVFIYACTDEIHQLFIPGRSGEVRDVLVDTSGGIIGIIVISSYHYIKSKAKK